MIFGWYEEGTKSLRSNPRRFLASAPLQQDDQADDDCRREAALRARNLIVRFIVCGTRGARTPGALGRAADRAVLRVGDARPWNAYRAAYAARSQRDARTADTSRCGEAALAEIDGDTWSDLEAAEESEAHERSLAQHSLHSEAFVRYLHPYFSPQQRGGGYGEVWIWIS